MFNAKEIANGFGNLLKNTIGLSSDKEKELFSARKAICDNCEHGQSVKCGKCGCIIAAKTKSIHSACPIDLW